MSRQRDVTDNLAEGIGRVRWPDDEKLVRELYPGAYVRHMPVVGAPLIVQDFVEVDASLEVKACFFFDPAGVKYVVLRQETGEEEVEVRPAVDVLARRWGFGPVSEARRQQWMVNGVQVLLQLFEWSDAPGFVSEFSLRVNRPGEFQSEFRIYEGAPVQRKKLSPRPFLGHPEQAAMVRTDGFVVCPGCGRAFSLRDSARWDGASHLTCGQRIRLDGV